MSTRPIALAIALSGLASAVCGPASAQEAESDAWMRIAESRTRAEVRAELLAARASGELARLHGEAADFDPPGLPPTRLAKSTA